MVPSVLEAFGRNVRRRRLELGLSQEKLASRAGLHRNYVGGIERGERNLALLSIVALAEALGVNAGELFEGVTSPLTHDGQGA